LGADFRAAAPGKPRFGQKIAVGDRCNKAGDAHNVRKNKLASPKLRQNRGASALQQKRGGQASDAIIICFLPLFWSVKDRWSMLGWAQLAFVAAPALQRAQMMNKADPIVIVIDDDTETREALGSLLRSVGLQVKLLSSIPDLLRTGRPKVPTCLVLDVRLPGRSGLDFQRELVAAGIYLPIVFITGHGDIPMSVQAMKGGAIEFLTKPFRHQDLLDAIQVGLDRDRALLENEREIAALRQRYESLTQREREVMALVVTGRLNKQIAGDIGLSEITVKVHRGHVMRKLGATSAIDLARMAEKLKILPAW
jgi:FixJ family two-component response regulator